MGNSKFWYYPDPPGNLLVEVDLGRTIGDMLVPVPSLRQSAATAYDNSRTIVQWGAQELTRIRMTWGGVNNVDRSVRRRLVAMLNHMNRGGSVMFAADSAKFYAGFITGDADPGATSITVVPSMSSIVSGVSLADTEIVLRSAHPRVIVEAQHVSAHANGLPTLHTMTINPGTHYDYADEAWVLVREIRSWPALRLPEGERGRNHLTSDHETAFTLDLPVEEDDVSLQLQFEAGGSELAGAEMGAADPGLVGGQIGPSGWTF